MLIGVEDAFWRDEFEHLDPRTDRPAVRPRAVPQLVFGLRQADVDAGLVRCGASEQELQRDRGLTGTRSAFEQVEAIDGQPAADHLVETGNPGPCFGQNVAHILSHRANMTAPWRGTARPATKKPQVPRDASRGLSGTPNAIGGISVPGGSIGGGRRFAPRSLI